jgi:hypothetical protein
MGNVLYFVSYKRTWSVKFVNKADFKHHESSEEGTYLQHFANKIDRWTDEKILRFGTAEMFQSRHGRDDPFTFPEFEDLHEMIVYREIETPFKLFGIRSRHLNSLGDERPSDPDYMIPSLSSQLLVFTNAQTLVLLDPLKDDEADLPPDRKLPILNRLSTGRAHYCFMDVHYCNRISNNRLFPHYQWYSRALLLRPVGSTEWSIFLKKRPTN